MHCQPSIRLGWGSTRNPFFTFPGLKIRSCCDSDIPFLRRLYGTTRAAELSTTGWSGREKNTFLVQQFNAQHTDWQKRFPHACYLLLLKKKTPIGRLYLDIYGESVRIVDLSLLPEVQGQGIGSSILVTLIGESRQLTKPLELSVDPINVRAQLLYHSLGFVETSRDHSRIHLTYHLK